MGHVCAENGVIHETLGGDCISGPAVSQWARVRGELNDDSRDSSLVIRKVRGGDRAGILTQKTKIITSVLQRIKYLTFSLSWWFWPILWAQVFLAEDRDKVNYRGSCLHIKIKGRWENNLQSLCQGGFSFHILTASANLRDAMNLTHISRASWRQQCRVLFF